MTLQTFENNSNKLEKTTIGINRPHIPKSFKLSFFDAETSLADLQKMHKQLIHILMMFQYVHDLLLRFYNLHLFVMLSFLFYFLQGVVIWSSRGLMFLVPCSFLDSYSEDAEEITYHSSD